MAVTRPSLHDGLLFGADAAAAAWVQARIPGCRDFGPCAALAVVRDREVVGGVVFSNFRPEAGDIEVSGAVAPGFRIGPAGLRRALRYAFVQLGCRRITARTGRRNAEARAFLERLGFRLEGVQRGGFDGRQAMMLYGMLKEDCRFLERDR